MALLVQLGSIVNFNVPMLETVFRKIGMDHTYEDFADRLDRARFWLEECAPEQANHLRAFRDLPLIAEMTEEEKTEIRLLHDYIAAGGYTLDDLSTKLYDIPKEVFGADAANLKQLQGRFFQLVYRLLLNKDRGPRLYLFLHAMDSSDILPLLDLDAEPTEQELHPELFEKKAEPVKKAREYGPADPVAPFKETVEKPEFDKLDLRVAKIVKCSEIRKARNNLKLTVFDGIKERTIVSSIKDEYEPEELIGRKIIILANLAPARLTGVESEGMLLAATNSACGCKVIFVDDTVPEGTPVL